MKKSISNIPTTFTARFQGQYITGYKMTMNARPVYMRRCYNGTYTFTLDYTLAKKTSYKTANRHAVRILQQIESGRIGGVE